MKKVEINKIILGENEKFALENLFFFAKKKKL